MFSMATKRASNVRHTSGAHSEDQYEGEDMQGCVVVAAVALGAALWTFMFLPAEQFGAQQMGRNVHPLHA
jgi:hypothetical protein